MAKALAIALVVVAAAKLIERSLKAAFGDVSDASLGWHVLQGAVHE